MIIMVSAVLRSNAHNKKGVKKRFINEIFEDLRKIALRNQILSLISTFEKVLVNAGYGKFMEEAKKNGVRSKPIMGRYVASKIIQNKNPIPDQMKAVIQYLMKKE